MKKLIDKFWIFWSKLKACCRFLFESKTTGWLVFYEVINVKTGEKTMTYQTEKTAPAGDIYNLMYTGYMQTAKIIIERFQEDYPEAIQSVYEHIDKSSAITDFLKNTMKVAKGKNSPLKKMSKIK